MKTIDVLICDDAKHICIFFEKMLNQSKKFRCVAKAQSESESIEKASETKPDIILLDVQMDTRNSGIEIIPTLFEVSPKSKIVIMSIHDDERTIYDAIAAGASDYCTKNQEPKEIMKILERVYKGDNEMRASIAKKITTQISVVEQRQKSLIYAFNNLLVLSKVELEILRDLCLDKSYNEIAEERNIELPTVRTHVHRILKKMNYATSANLIQDFKEMKIFDLFKG